MPELRITTGTAKNKRLKTPDIPGFRAVQEVAKSAVFSIIGDKVEGAVCLDLFAGSGNLGLEALSRGADWCDFVDASKESADAISANILNCGFFDRAEVFWKEAVKYVKVCKKKYDLVFMDPFYKDTAQKHLFNILDNITQPSTIIVFMLDSKLEHPAVANLEKYSTIADRRFGETRLIIKIRT